MHIVAEQIMRLCMSLFVYVWIALFLGVAGVAVLTSFSRKWRERRKLLVWVLLGPLLFYLTSFAASCAGMQLAANAWFDGSFERQVTRLVISSDSGSIEIHDLSVIRELLELLRNEPRVRAHHSHSTSEYQLAFPEIGYAFTLGADSEVEHEYWLYWDRYPGFDEENVSHIGPLRQVRSAEVTSWLDREFRQAFK
jgi:hypothetical protein